MISALFHLSLLLFTFLSVSAADFSAAERAWLDAHPQVRIGTYDRDAPYAIIDPDSGAVSGIAPDYVKLMFEKLGLGGVRVEWKFYSGKQIALKALKNGEIDLINPFYSGEAEAGESGVVVSKAVFGCSMSVLYRGEFTDRTMSVIASPYTRLGTCYVRDNYPDAKVVRCLHAYDCIDHLLKGEATSVVMYSGALRTAAETYGEEFNVKALNSLCGVAFASLPENAAAIGILNRGIDLIDKVELNRLETHYFIAEPTKISARRFFRSHPGYVFSATVFLFVTAIVVIVLVMQRRIARRTSAAKTAFLFSMSHDIRSPMNAVMGFNAMARGALDKSPVDFAFVRDCLHKSDEAGNLLLTLINSILDMSRIGSGKAKVEEVEMDVRSSFADVESTLMELAHAKDVTLTFEYGDVADRHVLADRARLSRVFMNLASNAVKYTKNGGRVKVKCEQVRKVKVKSKGGPEVEKRGGGGQRNINSNHLCPPPPNYSTSVATYRYTFEDNGIGMSEEFQKHVFDQFAREHTSTDSGVQGTGLGLALAKSFVDLMGGTIACRSKQGMGTTFTVELPFRVLEAVDEVEKRGGGGQRNKDSNLHCPPPPNYSTSFAGRRILLVEDNELNREVATYVLREQGLAVETAEDGSVAVRLVREKGLAYYDYVLMDIQMPIMNGYEATRAIREWEEGQRSKVKGQTAEDKPLTSDLGPLTSHVPIIALSANAFAEDREASLAAGMDGHVAKPIKVNELMSELAKFG